MHRKHLIATAALWAAAIVASAVVGAPDVLSAFLLPVLAVIALLLAGSGRAATGCEPRPGPGAPSSGK
ncbi:MAG: hypothetical protein ACXWCJ_08660 [Caldimonas sp.]